MPNKSAIPTNLGEALEFLLREITPQELENFKSNGPDCYHHGLGTALRNNWGLWGGSVLADWFIEKGIYHADDMSGIILTSLHRVLCKQDIDFAGQVASCQEYWKKIRNA